MTYPLHIPRALASLGARKAICILTLLGAPYRLPHRATASALPPPIAN
jgi:hypothetical protein